MTPRTGPAPLATARHVVAVGYVAVMVALAAVAAWPIYRSPRFVLLVVVATLVGTAIAVVATRRAWPAWATVAATAAAALIVGVLLAVPERLTGPEALPSAALDVLAGAVTGWKDLLTVELPVGAYRNLLVPALLVFLVVVVVALMFAWRRGWSVLVAVLACLAMTFFGLLFGRPVVSDAVRIGPFTLPAPVEIATGALALIASMLWLTWSAYDDRARSLRRAARASGVRMSRRRAGGDVRRMALGAVMVVGSVLAAVLVAPALAQGVQRDVLRSAAQAQLTVSRAVTPLTGYRSNFTDDAYSQVLFRVESEEGDLPERVRLATLDHYDGVLFRAVDPDAAVADERYERIPARRDAGAGQDVAVRIRIENLTGIWMPTVGEVAAVRFGGPRSAALGDGFYYNSANAAGIAIAGDGLRSGDEYVVEATVPATATLAQIDSPRVSDATPTTVALRQWMQAHRSGSDGAALAALIELLRERGYLSHALSSGSGETPAWMADLGEYVFQPSAAGHSLARIDALLERLLIREAEAGADGSPESLVAAVGDDEQFAVAAALLARELGFPSRVVVGARLVGAPGIPACEDGVCRAGDLVVWTEVQGADGAWVAVDVDPQTTAPPVSDAHTQRDPRNETEVRPDTAQQVDPPDPLQQDAAADDDPAPGDATDLSALWAGLRIGGIVLLLVLLMIGPWVAIVLAKALRRRSRRGGPDPAAQVIGGWEEYLDAATDARLPAPRLRTRSEIAQLHGSAAAVLLAERADRAVFSAEDTRRTDSEEFWRILDGERARLSRRDGFWRRLGTAVSLRSFARSLGPVRAARPASTTSERRTRRPAGEARTS